MTNRIHCYLFAALLLFCSVFVHAQNVRYDGVVSSRSGAPAAGAFVAVCGQPANSSVTPCSPVLPLCSSLSDVVCNQPNPLQADGLGNFHFYISGSSLPVTLQWYGSTVTTYAAPDQYLGGFGGLGATGTGVPGQIVVSGGTIGLANPTIMPGAGQVNGAFGENGASSGMYFNPDAACAWQGTATFQDQLCDLTGYGPVWNGGVGQPTQAFQLNKIQVNGYSSGQFNCWNQTNGDFEPGACAFGNQVLGESMAATSTVLLPTPATIYVSSYCGSSTACLTFSDESTAIQAIVTVIGGKGTMHIVDDMCGIQTWSVQPFNGPASNNMAGVFEFRGNCSNSNPHIVSLDGVSTILTPSGLWIAGRGTAQGGLTPQYGGAGNTIQGSYIRACNPGLYPCLHSGFTIPSCGVASIGAAASNLMLVTLTGGCSFPTSASLVNHVQQYRLVHIVGATGGGTTMNAAWVVSDCCTASPQTFHIAVPAGTAACAANCGTAYLDTPLLAIGVGGNGVFGNRIENLTIDCSFMPGCAGWVNGAGQEMNGLGNLNSWNAAVFGGRIDQSCAYAGVGTCTGSTNSGPYGPFSTNVQAATCGLTGGCACMGSSTSCSSVVAGTPGTAPKGTSMSCGVSGSTATISPDPCVNGNFHGVLFTGGGGQQGFETTSHVTVTISDKSTGGGSPVPQLQNGTAGGNTYSAGGVIGATIACGVGFYGIHGGIRDLHTEYFNSGLCIGGNALRTGTFYYAYTSTTAPANPAPTSGVMIDGGFGQVTNMVVGGAAGVMIDIGSQKSDAPQIGDIEIRDFNSMNGGGAVVYQNNISGETCKSFSTAPGSDYVGSYFFGHSTTVAQSNSGENGLLTPKASTSCSGLAHYTGNAFAVPLISTSAISSYGVPVKADTGNAGQYVQTVTTDTAAGIAMGVSYHSTSAGGFGQVVTTGVVPMLFGTNGTGNCAIGNFVIVDTVTNGHVKCTAVYAAGTVIGIALQAMTTTNTPFNVLVGLR